MKMNFLFKAVLIIIMTSIIVSYGIETNAAANAMTVNFPQSTSQSQSTVVTIPNLYSISSVTANTGSTSYSINGNNVTIYVSGGSSSSTSTSSTTASASVTSSSPSFSDYYYYSSGGYSGNIPKNGGYSSTVTGGSPASSIPISTSWVNVCTLTTNDNGYYYDDGGNNPAPGSIYYNDGTYSGTMTKGSVSSSSSSSTWTTKEGSKTIHWTKTINTYTAQFTGTATKPDTRTYSYSQSYYGTVYGSTTYYYSYNVTVNYITNDSPALSIISPTANGKYGISIIPSVSVSDPNGDTLTCKYYIDSIVKETKTISNTATAQTVSFNTLDIKTLTEGLHAFKFEVNDGIAPVVSQTINAQIDNNTPYLGTISFISDASSITISGTATDSMSGMNSLPYKYSLGSTIIDWTTDTSRKISSLSPNTSYTAKFEARDVVGNIASKEQNLYTKAQIPVFSTTNATETSLDISLTDQNPTTTQYQITVGSKYVNSDGTLSATAEWLTLSNKKTTVNGLTAGTVYSITAIAKNAVGEVTSTSIQVKGTTLAAPPVNITFEQAIHFITVSWGAVSTATGYDIMVDGTLISNLTSTNYIHSNLQAETIHTYKIRANNAGGTGNWSELLSESTFPNPPPVPGNVNIADVAITEITIAWDKTAGASSYDIEVDNTIVDIGTNTSYISSGLSPKSTHNYRVRGKNAGGNGEWSELLTMTTYPNPPVAPANIKSNISRTNVIVSWDAAEETTGYEVLVDSTIINVGADRSYTHDDLEASSLHSYKVRGWNAGGRGVWSESLDIITNPNIPGIPTNIMATAEKDLITLTWYKDTYVDSYDIEIDGSTVINLTDITFVNKQLEPDTKHTYRIRAINITGKSEWSSPITMFTLPVEDNSNTVNSLTNVTAVVTNNTVAITWDAAAQGAEYDIEVDGVLSGNGDKTVFNHTGLEQNSFHTYKIKVKNGDDINAWCAVLALSTLPNPPDAPTNLRAEATNTSIELRWDEAINATDYEIEVDGEVKENGGAVIFKNEGLKPGTSHIYRVRARNVTGVTAWSPSLTKSTTSPTYVIACKNGEEFDLSLLATNVQDFTGMKFVITYEANEITLTDLYGLTPLKDTIAQGKIPNTNITVTYTQGRIEFTVNENIAPGTFWSGELTTLVFKPKVNGETFIDFKVE